MAVVDGFVRVRNNRVELPVLGRPRVSFVFFLNDPPPPELSPLPHHAALPIPPPAGPHKPVFRVRNHQRDILKKTQTPKPPATPAAGTPASIPIQNECRLQWHALLRLRG